MKERFSIVTLVAEQAAAYPHAPALCALDCAPLSYAALYHHLYQTVERLNGLGVGRGDRVAIVLPNGPAMALAFLAVSACATAAPLNPTYRAAEVDFYLSHLNAKAVVVASTVDAPVREVAAARRIPIIELVPDATTAGLFTLAGQAAASTSPGFAEADDVALILHTSGTTARPKMVPLTGRNILQSAYNIGATLALAPADRCLNVMPLFHIHGLIAALLSSLAAGGSVVCTPGFEAARFLPWLNTEQPTWYTAVPTMHQAILARAAVDGINRQEVALRFIRSSSSALPPTVMAALEETFGAPVIEAYGMTEAAHQMASNPLPPRTRKPGSVGLAAGPQVAIMDEATERILPTATRGEVVIRGQNVMAGYLDQVEANAKAFVKGWFRTGDQGYLDEEGYLYLTGRLKEIINRGGEKIAPREVDEVLLAHPAVAQALTFALPHAYLGETVAAAVAIRPGSAVTATALRDYVATRLAYFKVPSQIYLLDTIPPGPTGKLQRIGFAERMGIAPPPITPAPAPYVAPRTPFEATLVDLWRQLLHVDEIGIHTNFLDIGGDSLAATRLATQILEHFQLELPLHVLLNAPTIAEQALAILQSMLDQQTSVQVADLITEVKQATAEVSPLMGYND